MQVCDHVAVAVDFGLRLRGKKGGGGLQALCEEVGRVELRMSCDALLIILQVAASIAGGHVPVLPDMSCEAYMCAVGGREGSHEQQAASATATSAADSAAAAAAAAAAATATELSDVEIGSGIEQVLLEEQLVVKFAQDGEQGEGGGSMACDAQVILMSDVVVWTPLHVKACSQQLQLKHVVTVMPMRSNPRAFILLATTPPPPPTPSSSSNLVVAAPPPPPVTSGWAIGGLLLSYLTPSGKNGSSSSSSSCSITFEASSADACARWSLAIKCLVAAVKRRQAGEGGGGVAAAHLFDESSISMQVHVPPASWELDVAAAPALHSLCPACSLPLQQPPPPPPSSSWLPSLTSKGGGAGGAGVGAAVPASCPQFCFYTGRWFCSSCHVKETAALPGYAATFFDLQQRAVCRSAAAVLQARHMSHVTCHASHVTCLTQPINCRRWRTGQC